MKTNEIYLGNEPGCRDEALKEADKYADYQEIRGKDKIHVRLLTEELISMLDHMTGDYLAYFWIEDDNNAYYLHLSVKVKVDSELRKALLENTVPAPKSIKSTLREVFSSYINKENNGTWVLSAYRSENHPEGELEKSIIASLASDVTVRIQGDKVEMVIQKNQPRANISPYEKYIKQRIKI